MSKASDVGISPVLLQAISQSLSSSKSGSLDSTTRMANTSVPSNGKGAADETDLVAKFMKEQQGSSLHSELVANTSSSDTIKTMLKLKMAANALSRLPEQMSVAESSGTDSASVSISTLASDLAMANMLTALASQAGRGESPVSIDTGQITGLSLQQSKEVDKPLRAIRIKDSSVVKSEINESTLTGKSSLSNAYTEMKEPDLSEIDSESVRVASTHKTVLSQDSGINIGSDLLVNPDGIDVSVAQDSALAGSETETSISATKAKTENSLVLAFSPTPGTSSDQNVIDMSAANTVRIIEHNGKRYIIQMQAIEKDSSPEAAVGEKDDPILRFGMSTDSQDSDSSPFTNVVEQEVVTVGQQQESSALQLPSYKANMAEMNGTPCPVCGDNVSGRVNVTVLLHS